MRIRKNFIKYTQKGSAVLEINYSRLQQIFNIDKIDYFYIKAGIQILILSHPHDFYYNTDTKKYGSYSMTIAEEVIYDYNQRNLPRAFYSSVYCPLIWTALKCSKLPLTNEIPKAWTYEPWTYHAERLVSIPGWATYTMKILTSSEPIEGLVDTFGIRMFEIARQTISKQATIILQPTADEAATELRTSFNEDDINIFSYNPYTQTGTFEKRNDLRKIYKQANLPGWYNESIFTKQYTIFMAYVDGIPIGVVGVNHENLEFRDDAIIVQARGKNAYKKLCMERNKWINTNYPNNVYNMFTDVTGKNEEQKKKIIENQIKWGLALMDLPMPYDRDTYTCKLNNKTYINLNGIEKYIVFRKSPANVVFKRQFIKLGEGVCSGTYVGNGIIVTAHHCDNDQGQRSTESITTIRLSNLNNKILTYESKIYHDFDAGLLDLNDILFISTNITNSDKHDLQCEHIPFFSEPMLLNDKDIHTVLGQTKKLQPDLTIISPHDVLIVCEMLQCNVAELFDRVGNNYTYVCQNLVQGNSGGPIWYINSIGQKSIVGVTGTRNGAAYVKCQGAGVAPTSNTNVKVHSRSSLLYSVNTQ